VGAARTEGEAAAGALREARRRGLSAVARARRPRRAIRIA